MLEQDVNLEIFLIAGLDPEAVQEQRCVTVRDMRGGVAWKTAIHPVADILLKVPVLDRVIPDIRCPDDMHEQIIGDFHKVAEPHYRLQRLLRSGYRRHRQYYNTYQCHLCQPFHKFSPP